MQIPCPSCGEQLPISDQLLGKKIRCGGCRAVVDIPEELGENENGVGPSATVAAIGSNEMPDQAIAPVPSAPTKSPAAQHPTPASAQSDDNAPTMLVDCVCGNRSRVPTSSAGSEVRCPSCQRLMRIPNPPAERNPTFISGGTFPQTPLPKSNTIAAASVAQAPLVHPYPVHPKQQPTEISNTPIIITAVCCLFALMLLIGTAVLLERRSEKLATAEPVQEESESETADRVSFQEGYSMILPPGCKQESREEIGRGSVVYRFNSEAGFGLTVAIIPDESIDLFSSPPKDIRKAFVKGIKGLDINIDAAEIQPKHLLVNGLRAVMFRFSEEEYYTGVRFTYFMVVLDKGTKLVLSFSGKNGDDKEITWPHHWQDSLVTLRNESYVKKPNAN